MKAEEVMIGVVVTTKHRGVFFGYVRGETVESGAAEFASLTLKHARNIVYWSQDVRGFLGLAATGPLKGCRVGPSVPSLALSGITSIAECTPEAVENWEKGPWA